MKVLKVLSFIVLLIQVNLFPQLKSKWSWVTPYPTGSNLSSVYFLNPSTGFLLGADGVLMKTIDTAKTWVQLNLPSDVKFEKMFFADSLKGWAYGSINYYQPVMYKTYNGGEKWFKQTIPQQLNNLRDIFFLDSLNGWTAGDHGIIFKTTNGGKTWLDKTITSGIVPAIVFIQFEDQLKGTIIGSYYNNTNSLLLGRTINGGETWKFEESGLQNYMFDAVINDSAIITAGSKLILKSGDSGKTWSFKMGIPLDEYMAIDFYDKENGIIGSSSGNFLRTSNTGSSWEIIPGIINTSLVSVQYINKDNIWACGNGMFGNRSAVLHSTDRGSTWKNKSRTLDDVFQITGLHFSSSSTGWLAGGNFIYKSIDNGKTWNKNYSSNNFFIGDIYFIDSLKGIACGTDNGSRAVILKTTNGGSSWESEFHTSFSSFYKFSAPNADTIYALDNYGLSKSVNRGESWTAIYNSITGYISDLHFINGEEGYLVNQNGNLFKTTNGGGNWILTQLSNSENLYRVSFPTKEVGYILGSSNIYKTIDGGNSWEKVNLPEYAYDIIFTDPLRGWLTTSNGIYSTINGGSSWNIEFHSFAQLYSFFYGRNGLWLTGEASQMLKYTADTLVNVQENNAAELPNTFSLAQNFPNPFNPSTTIKYNLPMKSNVLLKVYTILGEEAATLINEEKPAGTHNLEWNAGSFASGVYVYTIEAIPLDKTKAGFRDSKKLILIK